MNVKKIGEFIAKLRRDNNLTQQELGDKLFVTNKAVSKWERGLSIPDITVLEQMAKLFDVEISEILNGEKSNLKKVDLEKEVEKAILELDKKKKRILAFLITILLALFIYIIFINLKFEYDMSTIIYNHNIIDRKIKIGIPKYSFLLKQNDRSYSYYNLRSSSVLNNEFKEYLNTLEYSLCNNTIYYYSEEYDYSVIEYKIDNNFIFRTISFEIVDGDYCTYQKIDEYSKYLGILKGIHSMNSKMKLDKNGNPLQNEYLSIMFIDGGTDMTKYSFEAELKVYYTIWNKKQILLEHSYGDYEIKNGKLYYYRKNMVESDDNLKIPEVSVFEIKDYDLILIDNYLSKYESKIVLEGINK